MHVLLTGASGFIGRSLLARLVREGCTVEAVHRSGNGISLPDVRWHQVDVWNAENVKRLIHETRPTHLILNAWIATPGIFWSSPDNERWRDATISLVHEFGKCGGKHIVGLGSCAEYDWNSDHFIEDKTPERPNTLYGQTKLAAMQTIFDLQQTYGFHAAWGRIFMPYGPGDAAERLTQMLVRHLLAGQEIKLSSGQQTRDFIYVDDVAEAVIRLLRQNSTGVFNLGTGIGTNIRNMAQMVAAQYDAITKPGKPSCELLRFNALEDRAEPATLVADITKLRKELNWQPEISLSAGIARLLAAAISR